jgi:hypothetical protein
VADEANLQPFTHEHADGDCFAEFILGLAGGETRGLAMTLADAGVT